MSPVKDNSKNISQLNIFISSLPTHSPPFILPFLISIYSIIVLNCCILPSIHLHPHYFSIKNHIVFSFRIQTHFVFITSLISTFLRSLKLSSIKRNWPKFPFNLDFPQPQYGLPISINQSP